MKIIHCECGLGNQMCYYAMYLAVKNSNTNDECLFETLFFDIPELDKHMKMWNGYELEKIFGIKVPNVVELINEDQHKAILENIENSKFWEKGWGNSRAVLSKNLSDVGIYNGEIYGEIQTKGIKSKVINFENKYRNSAPMYYLRRIYSTLKGKYKKENYTKTSAFKEIETDKIYFSLFDIIAPNSGLCDIKDEVFSAFTFPEFEDNQNKEMAEYISTVNSVSMHIRKSDCFKYNADCFKFGYFKRAVKHIRKNVENPVFIVFSDDAEWVKGNLKTLGLNKNDEIKFVTWNNAENSYRDMQLMSLCKHNISTNSTFGFWASYLNRNLNKITISPKGSFDTTNWF